MNPDNVTNKANEKVSEAADTARNLADSALSNAQSAVKGTRKLADESLEKAEESVRALRREVDPLIDDLACRAQELATRSINYCAETSARARRQLDEATLATTRYVSEQPGKSVLIAAAVGAAIATLAISATRRH